MPRALIVLTTLFAALSVAVACGAGDSSPNAEETAPAGPVTPSSTEETTAGPVTPSSTIEGTPSDGTPGVTRITPPSDTGEYLNQYAEEEIVRQRCTLDGDTGQVDCSENGVYELDQPPQDDDAECSILLVNDEPIAVRCASQEPLAVIYYAIAQ